MTQQTCTRWRREGLCYLCDAARCPDDDASAMPAEEAEDEQEGEAQ